MEYDVTCAGKPRIAARASLELTFIVRIEEPDSMNIEQGEANIDSLVFPFHQPQFSYHKGEIVSYSLDEIKPVSSKSSSIRISTSIVPVSSRSLLLTPKARSRRFIPMRR